MPSEKLERRECFVTENTSIVQSNFLIERKEKLSLPATQLLYTLTGMINRDDADLKEYKVDVSYFANLWGVDLKLAYQTVADALTELNSKGIRDHSINPKTGNKVFTTVNFISFGRYEHGEGYATVRIEPELKPHYIALQSKFTMYSLGNILQLQENGGQVNAMRTYELLKQYQNKGKRKFTVAEYKEQLGLITYDKKGNVVKEKYKGSIANLKIKVLEPTIEKINSSTDIEAEYEIIGRGSKAVIDFTIRENKKTFMAISSEASKSEASEQEEIDENQTTIDDFIVEPAANSETQDSIFATPKYQYKNGHVEFLALACDYEFDQTEMEILLSELNNKPFDFDPFLEKELGNRIMFDFVQKAYRTLNLKAKNMDIKNRVTYLQGIIRNMDV